jgi:hypothetical protein
LRFNKELKNKIVERGLAEPHHVMADSGWVSYSIVEGKSIDLITQLGILAYEWRVTLDEAQVVSKIRNL